MAQNIPPELEKDLRKFENLRRQQEAFTNMVETYKERVKQLNETLDNLKKQPDDTVTYKAVGQVMFKVEKPAMVDELVTEVKGLEKSIVQAEKKLETLTPELTELQTTIQLELSKRNLRLQ
ncbi:MAG: prefoldin subunit [Candidatus Thorarchaeota archaeon]|jgi:prefoldin beta subunit